MIFSSFLILLAFYAVGAAVERVLGLPLPGSVVGMVLLSIALFAGWIRVERVAPAADLLLSQLGLLFVPPAVAIMAYFDRIADEWVALAIATVGSLIVVLWTTAGTAEILGSRRGSTRARSKDGAND